MNDYFEFKSKAFMSYMKGRLFGFIFFMLIYFVISYSVNAGINYNTIKDFAFLVGTFFIALFFSARVAEQNINGDGVELGEGVQEPDKTSETLVEAIKDVHSDFFNIDAYVSKKGLIITILIVQIIYMSR